VRCNYGCNFFAMLCSCEQLSCLVVYVKIPILIVHIDIPILKWEVIRRLMCYSLHDTTKNSQFQVRNTSDLSSCIDQDHAEQAYTPSSLEDEKNNGNQRTGGSKQPSPSKPVREPQVH